MQKIVPHLWYDKEAAKASRLYTAALPGSSVCSCTVLEGTPSGRVETVAVELGGQEFTLMSAGPYFTFNPSVSFLVACSSKEETDRIYGALREGGSDLMPLDAYPFSERYAWVQDRFGLSWQIMYRQPGSSGAVITPTFLFTGGICGRAEEAVGFWTSVFRNARTGDILRYGPGEEPDKAGTVKHAAFVLEGQEFAAMDSAFDHKFGFNEAVSLQVFCDTQEELDYYWDRLSAAPEAEQCGWLKDRFGLSWQIVPRALAGMMTEGSAEAKARVTRAFLGMKKLDLAQLEKAYASS